MKLPTFEEAKQAVIERRGTPLDKFVAYWETEKEQEMFRTMLAELLEWQSRMDGVPVVASIRDSEIEEAIADLPRHQMHPAIAEGIVEEADRSEKMMINANYGTQENLIRSFWNPTTGLYENDGTERRGEVTP